MENDEKRKKVIDELERRKMIAAKGREIIGENLKELYRKYLTVAAVKNYEYYDNRIDYYTMYIARCTDMYLTIDEALEFVKDDLTKYDKCDYSTLDSFINSAKKGYENMTEYKSKYRYFDSMQLYIGNVIEDINDDYYPNVCCGII